MEYEDKCMKMNLFATDFFIRNPDELDTERNILKI